MKEKVHSKKQRLLVTSTIILSTLIASFLLFTYFGDKKTEASLEIDIVEILIAQSKSETTFQAASMSNLKTIKINNDATFENEVERFFKHIKPLSTTPTYTPPAFDIKISTDSGSPLKVKVWEIEGNIYLYNIDEDKYYTSAHRSALNVYKMISNIPFPQ